MKFKIVYTKIVKETIEADNLDLACILAQKKAKLKSMTVQSVTPILTEEENEQLKI